MKTRTQNLSPNSPRVRFNWGFHDATLDRQTGFRDRRAIPIGDLSCLPVDSSLGRAYAAGYAAGQRCDMSRGRPETSDAAWAEYVEAKHET